jgi:hypothetical protein
VSAFQERFEGDPREGAPVEPAVEHRVIRRTSRRIGEGTLACPCCDLPVLPVEAISATSRFRCPFCAETRPAGQFLRLDSVDTPANRVYVRARLPLPLSPPLSP